MEKRLFRSVQNRKLAGICSGLADYFDMDVTIVRIIFLLLLFFSGIGFILYVIIWIVVPEMPVNKYENAEEFSITADNTDELNKPNRNKKSGGQIYIGIVLIIIGAVIFADNYIDIDFEMVFPIIMIILGLGIIFRNTTKLQ